jgi:hypothetical protein
VSLHRRQLPIASPCERFEGTEASADRAAFCTRCDKHVHDLSRLSEPEVVNLLARHRDREICISYRARTDGTIALRKPAPRLAPAAMALSLAGCAGHLTEAESSASGCVDAAGYQVECPPTSRLGMAVIPDAATAIDPAQLEDDEATIPAGVDIGELDIDTATVRGGVFGGDIAVDPQALEPVTPEPVPIPTTDDGLHATAGVYLPAHEGKLARQVKRESRRIERQERRDARALAKR